MTISPAKRLWLVLIGSIVGWAMMLIVIGLPIFHLHFKVPIATIASYAGTCCVVQVVVFAWLFRSRQTHPDRWVFNRTLASTIFVTTISMLFFYYLRRGRPDSATREFTSIGMGVSLLFAVLLPLISFVSRRMRNG